jgi:hypothetical protein
MEVAGDPSSCLIRLVRSSFETMPFVCCRLCFIRRFWNQTLTCGRQAGAGLNAMITIFGDLGQLSGTDVMN